MVYLYREFIARRNDHVFDRKKRTKKMIAHGMVEAKKTNGLGTILYESNWAQR